MPQFERDGVEFNVTLDGPENAPPLMLSNSLGTNLHMWDPQIPELTKHFRVIRYDSRGHGKREPAIVQKIVRMLHTTPAHGYAASCSAIRDMDQRESIRAVTNPVLVVVGSRDPATPPEMGRHIANAIPGARIVTLEAAHLSN